MPGMPAKSGFVIEGQAVVLLGCFERADAGNKIFNRIRISCEIMGLKIRQDKKDFSVIDGWVIENISTE